MQTPEHPLSPSELRLLRVVASGNQNEVTVDFLAFQRLKAFGLISTNQVGRPTITDQGKHALRLSERTA